MNENVTRCGLAEVVSVELLSDSVAGPHSRMGPTHRFRPSRLAYFALSRPLGKAADLQSRRYNTADKRPER
jgi:hypothetical protein